MYIIFKSIIQWIQEVLEQAPAEPSPLHGGESRGIAQRNKGDWDQSCFQTLPPENATRIEKVFFSNKKYTAGDPSHQDVLTSWNTDGEEGAA